jgi:type I restriction enzyme S subunit
MVPDSWRDIPMAKLVERIAQPVEVMPEKAYQEIGIRSHGKGLFDKEPVLGKTLGNKRVFWVEPNCFVVNIVFAWEQAVARTTGRDQGKIASHRFPMYRPRAGQADVDFLTYLFKTSYGKYLLSLASPGGAGRNKTLGQAEFLKIVVRVPPLREQQKIAEILSTWDQAIQALDSLIENAEAERQGLMREVFSGERRLPGFSNKWQPVTLGALGRFYKGKGITRADVAAEGIPCIRYGEIYTHHSDYIRDFHSFITPEIAATSQRIRRGDLLFAGSGETPEEIGKCVAYLNDDEAYAGGDIVIFRPKNSTDSKFLAYLMNHSAISRQKARFAQGNQIVHISASNLSKLSFNLPERPEQRAIAGLFDAVDNRLKNLRQQAQLLRAEKSALMQQLLTGSRRVLAEEVAA